MKTFHLTFICLGFFVPGCAVTASQQRELDRAFGKIVNATADRLVDRISSK